jgi:hypothetical protein
MFYLDRVVLNLNKKYVMPIPYAQQGDTARVLTFSILDKGVPFNLTGKTVRAKIVKPDKTKCYNDLTITNATNGECTLNLTNQILAVAGNVNCQLEIKEGEELLSTIIFSIDVEPSIDISGAVESTNEFTALENGIIKLDEWDKYFKETSGAIEEKYTERLNGIDSYLEETKNEVATKVDKVDGETLTPNKFTNEDKVEVSKVKNKMDKNTTDISVAQINPNLGKFGESYLTEELLAKIAGTAGINSTPANLSLTTLKYINKSITPSKTSFLKCSSNLFNHNTKTVGKAISADGVISDNSSYTITDFIEIIPNQVYSSYGFSNVVFYNENREFIRRNDLLATGDKFTGLANAYYVRFNSQNVSAYRDSQQLNLGGDLLEYEKWYEPYFDKVTLRQKSIESNLIKDNNILPSHVNFIKESTNIYDTSLDTERVAILADGNIVTNNMYNTTEFISVIPFEIYSIFGFAYLGLYDKDKNFIKRISPENGYSDSKFIPSADVFYIRASYQPSNANSKTRRINIGSILKDYEDYYIKFNDTHCFRTLNEVIENRKDKYMIDIPIDGVFSTNETYADYTSSWTKITPSEVYALYDELLAKYPTYITKQVLGNDAWGNSISAYHFTPQLPLSDAEPKIPKIFLTNGVHGNEKASTLSTYLFVKQMCEKWEEYPLLEALRFNVKFIIIPICNPSGWKLFTRQNANKVDLNRNFPFDWSLGTVGDSQYGGSEPFSELESQYIARIFEQNKDIDIMYDFHNFHNDNTNNNTFLWIPTANETIVKHVGQNLYSRMTRKWRKELSFIPKEDYFVGYSSTVLTGSVQNYAFKKGARFSGTFEICWRWELDVNSVPYNKDMCKCGVEALVNLLLISLRELIK